MADITKGTISALAVTARTARKAERAALASYMSNPIGQHGWKEAEALAVAAELALVTELDAYAAATFATLSTNLTGTHNDLTFTAVRTGASGTGVTIAYIDPAGETAAETVTITDQAITVTLRSVSAVLSTANQVKAALDAQAVVSALITTALKAGNDGTGVVTALTATNLA